MLDSPCKGMSAYQLTWDFNLRSNPTLTSHVDEYLALLNRKADLEETIRALTRLIDKRTYAILTESETAAMKTGTVQSKVVVTEENLTDVAGETPDSETAGNTTAVQTGQNHLLDPTGFLNRPVRISLLSRAVGADINLTELKVWNLFTLIPSVRSKLRNFAFLRGDLNLRFAIAGSPFHYGRVIFSYQPYPLKNEALQALIAFNTSTSGAFRDMLVNYLTQAPGAIVMDIKENQPVDMHCPFISTKPMHRLFNTGSTAISAGTPYDDLANAGSLYIITKTPLLAASDTPGPVSIFTYAWMTDVELGCPTGTQVAISTESETADERKTGPIEQISSRAAQAASALMTVPWIAPFATASHAVLSGVSQMSAIFGWSKPILTKPPAIVKNNPLQNGANTIGVDTNFKITLDPNQELTVDPRVLGSGQDEMAINHITCREALFMSSTWDVNTPLMSDPFILLPVSPYYNSTIFTGGHYSIQPTPLAFAAMPFAFWRGDIIFKFEIVCSKFHRGKLAFFFEPNLNQVNLINADIATNKQYLKVIDIQETQSIEFCVNWAYPRAWARVPDILDWIYPYDDIPITNFLDCANGYIGVTAFTELTSNDDSPVQVYTYVSSENMQFNYLTKDNLPRTRKIAESESATVAPTSCYELNPSTADSSKIAEIHFGERPVSFRALLKRYSGTFRRAIPATPSDSDSLRATMNIIPSISLPYDGAVLDTTGYLDLFSYLRYAYVGLRGGMRYRIYFPGLITNAGASTATTSQIYNSVKVTLEDVYGAFSPSIVWAGINTPFVANANGTVTFLPFTNEGIEVELPFYTNNLFLFSFSNLLIGPETPNDSEDHWVKAFTIAVDVTGAAIADANLVLEWAIAEDFSLMRFQGAPYFSL